MVLLASVGFALLIGFRHFNLNQDKLNGKQRWALNILINSPQNLNNQLIVDPFSMGLRREQKC
jgi:hypothetical protein